MRALTFITVLCLWDGSGFAQVLTLAELERMALTNNPTLAQAQAQVAVADGKATQAGLFPNPTIGYSGEEISRGPVIRGGEHGFFVAQTIPLGGKLRLSRRVFEREVVQAEAVLEGQRLRVLNTVRALYYEALAVAKRVELRERLTTLSAEVVTVSQQLFNVGAADRPDLLEGEIEAQQAQLALVGARNSQDRTWRRLAQVVGDPTLVPQPLAGNIDAVLPTLDRERALETLVRDSPELRAAKAAVERAELALQRARKEPFPDLIVRAGPRYNRELLELGPQPVGWEAFVDIGLTVPLFDRNQGNVAVADAELVHARAEVVRLELTLRSRLADVFEQYSTALQRAHVYRTEIVPRAQEAHNLFRTRFRETAAAYPQVLIAQRTLVQVTEDYLDALEVGWRAVVQIQGLLLMGGLDAPAVPGAAPTSTPGMAISPSEMSGVVSSGFQD